MQNKEKERENAKGAKDTLVLRNHFLYVFEQAWAILIVVAGSVLGNGDARKQSDSFRGLPFFGVSAFLFLVILLFYLRRWRKTTVTIADGMIIHTKATWNRKVNTISVVSISNINIEQNILERFFGVCKLKVDTNSLSTAEKTDLCILLRKQQAWKIKKRITRMMEECGKENGNGYVQQNTYAVFSEGEEEEYDVMYSLKEVLQNAVMGIPVSWVLLFAVFLIFAYITAGNIQEERKSVFSMLSVGILPLSYAFVFLSLIGKRILADFHFRARRAGDIIYVSCGLFQKKQYTIPVQKINAISIQYTLLGRIAQKGYIKVINIGGEAEEADGRKLLLTDSGDQLKKKLAILLPEFCPEDVLALKLQNRKVLRLRLVQSMVLCLLFYFGELYGIQIYQNKTVSNQALLCAGIFAVSVAICALLVQWLKYKVTAIYCAEKYLVLSHGTFGKRIEYIPYDKIQYISYSQGPLEGMLGMKKGKVFISANLANVEQKFGVFDEEVFETLEKKWKETYS